MGYWTIKLGIQMMASTKASKVWFSYSHNNTLANGAVFHSLYWVWLSSGVAHQNVSLLATVHDCETDLLFKAQLDKPRISR